MDKLKSMQLLLDVVETRSFTAAADKNHLSRAYVSKSIQQLEAYLQTRLLTRTTRTVTPTEIGKHYSQRIDGLLSELQSIEDMARQQNEQPSGRINISAPTSFGILQLTQLLPVYYERYPQVQVSINLADRFIDVVAEGYDLVIRIAKLEDSSLIARKLAPCQRVFCASPDYLQQHGTPQTPGQLSKHAALIYTNEHNPEAWIIEGPDGQQTIKVNGPMCSDNGDLLRSAALSGMGITLLPTFIVGDDLRSGQLQQILPEYCPPDIAIFAVYPSRRYLSATVRSFVDFLSEYFGPVPPWDLGNSKTT